MLVEWISSRCRGRVPLPAGTLTLGTVLRDAGYATACIGKWPVGPDDDPGAAASTTGRRRTPSGA